MRLLTSFYTPDSGTILVNGVDTQEDDLLTRSDIGYLPENNPLYEDLLVSEYLAFIADLRGMSGAERRVNLDQTIGETGLAEVYHRPINELSKGYHQRVGLAQAILHRPPILVLDEPTEGLDPNQRITLRELIRTLGQDRTVLLSTHVMQEVEATCERVLVISRGQLVADSPVEDLLKRVHGVQSVYLEVEGNEVETALHGLANVDAVRRQEPVDGRKRYIVSVSGDEDVRPEIFRLAKRRDWVLWELHEERARLEDVFHDLTTDDRSGRE
jgi:ABC-2 type transport system ATP-binding protein